MYNYIVSVPSMMLVQRGINFILTYFVTLYMAVKGYAAYSLIIYICNLSYQILKYGFDYRFQRLLHKMHKQYGRGERFQKIVGFYFSKIIILSVLGFCLAIFIYLVLFKSQFTLSYVDTLGVFLLIFSLFGLGFIITNNYAYRIDGVIEIFLSLQLLGMVIAVGLIFCVDDHLYFLIFALSSALPVIAIIICYYPCIIRFDIRLFSCAGILFKTKLRPESIIYINNISINVFQLILMHMISLIAITWVAEYRVLQALHAALSLAPLAATGFLINGTLNNKNESSTHGNFLIFHIYVILCGIMIFFRSVIAGFFPGYSQIIIEYLPLFLAINSVTIISNSFIFSVYNLLSIKTYILMLLAACLINILAFAFFDISNFKNLIVFDVLLQVSLYLALLFSHGCKALNGVNVFNWVYATAIVLINAGVAATNASMLVLILISSSYLIFSKVLAKDVL